MSHDTTCCAGPERRKERQVQKIKMTDSSETDVDVVTMEVSANIEELATLLDVPSETLLVLASSEEYKVVLNKFVELYNAKDRELEEYQSTVREFSDNLDMTNVQMREKDNQIEELTKNQEQELSLREELQITINRYAEAELESNAQLEESAQTLETAENDLEKMRQEMNEAQAANQNSLEEMRQELREMEESLQSKQRDLEESDETIAQLRQDLEQRTQQLELSEAELTNTRERVAELSVPPPEVPGADRQELLRMLDRRQHEISRLAEEWKNMSSQLELTSAKKTEFQTRLDELVVQEASLRLKEQLLQQEKILLKSQNEWLSAELQSKSEQLLSLRKEKTSSLSEMEGRLTQKLEEVKHLSSVLEDQRKAYSSLEGKAEEVLNKSRLDKEEMAKLEEQLRKELAQQAKLTELYKSASTDSESRVNELLSGVEKLQSLYETVTMEKEQLQAQLETEMTRNETVERDLSTSLASQKQELSHANDLLTSLRHRGVSLSEREVLSLSPAAAKASALLKSGKSLTQIYSEHIEVCDQLEQSKQENLTLNNYIEQIVQELSEKTPALQKLRRDYDSSVQTVASLNQKVDGLMDECATLRLEGEDSVKQYHSSQREVKRLKALTADLGRQVKVLLKECEEVRGGVASSSMMSHDYHMDVSSGDISSSSQAITQQLVEFKTIEELQEQNQRLLLVCRELGEQNEERERESLDERTRTLKSQLDEALDEVKELQQSRQRQTEMVKSIVQQRDMYRTLLAQATPLPSDSVREETERDGVGRGDGELANELKELKEQFEAYRKEKVTNDKMLLSQVEETRDKCSELRLDNAKLVSKLEHACDRYKLLDNQTSSIKKELEALRAKNLQLSNALSSHQTAIGSTTQELITARERLAKAEVSLQSMKTERDMLEASERRARGHYEELLREQRGHQVLLTNLQSIQNNFEKSEFETRTRLGGQIKDLERELSLYKDKFHTEEDRRAKMSEAYDLQVKDLEGKLQSFKESKKNVDETLRQSEETVSSLRAELSNTGAELDQHKSQLEEATDKILRLEADAGSEFRGKIRVLERQLADSKVKVQSLEGQLESSRRHADEYKSMSEAYEGQLSELNTTTEEYKQRMEQAQSEAQQREQELVEKTEQLTAVTSSLEEQLKQLTEDREKQVSDLEAKVSSLTSENTELQLELTTTREDVGVARRDIEKYAESASETQSHYQRELAQHGRTMEGLLAVKDQLKSSQEELSAVKMECEQLGVELATARSGWEQREKYLTEQCAALETRAGDLNQQNTLLHQEAEKLSARVLTLQDQTNQTLDTSIGSLDTSGAGPLEDKSTEQLWEIIRYVRREREIASTRQELAESENTRSKQQVEHLEKQLSSAQSQLKELTEAAQLHTESASQHAEILAKVESLNVLNDSNKLLRGERDRQAATIAELEGRCEGIQGEMSSLRETNKLLTAQKDALVAEKTALRNEVQRWNTRTNQLIEQYNKIDPEEYKKLLEERDATSSQLVSLQEEVNGLQSQLTASHSEKEGLETQCSSLKEQVDQTSKEKEGLAEEVNKLQADVTSKQEEIQTKNVLVGKLRDLGRKYRQLHEEGKKELEEKAAEMEELKKKLDEAQRASAESSSAPPPTGAGDEADKSKELEEAQSTIEGLRVSLQQSEDKYNKIVKTVKVARNRIQALTTDKDKALKEAETANSERDKLRGEMEVLQQEVSSLKEKHEGETTKLNSTITKLQQVLKERGPRRKVVPPSISEGPPTLQSSAPTAAVKPTVTTTPTASIRPMAIQTTTTAPMAHVTPTMVAPVNSTQLTTMSSTSTTPAATVFLRTSSPQVPTRIPSTSAVSSSISSASTSTIGIARASAVGGASAEEPRGGVTKRQREDDEQEGGASTSVEPPASKRKKPLQIQRLRQRQVEVAASSSLSPDTQGEAAGGTPDTQGEGPTAEEVSHATESQVLAAESQNMEQSQSEGAEEPSVVPQSDMDTQPSGRTEGVMDSEYIEPVSPPLSREGSELPQVSQSQEQPSVESSDRQTTQSSEATVLTSEAEIAQRDNNEAGEGALPELEQPMSEVTGTDSNLPPVDSSMAASEGRQEPGGVADTTQRTEDEGVIRGVSEPLSEEPQEEPSEEMEEEEVGSEAGDAVTEEQVEGVTGADEDAVDVQAPEGSVDVESEARDDVESEGREQVEGEEDEGEEGDDVESEGVEEEEEEEEEEEGMEEEEEPSDQEEEEEEEEIEEDEEDNLGQGTISSPIVIESSSSSEDEQERKDVFQMKVETSSDEEDDESSESSEPARTEEDESHDHADGSHDQEDQSHDPPHEQYEPAGPTASGFEYVPSGAGLPEDEPSVNLEGVQPARPTSMPSVRRVLNQGLQFSGERSTTAVTPGFEAQTEDSVVPHTPVLNEGKQLGMATRPHPLPSSHTFPQTHGSTLASQSLGTSLTAQSLQASEVDPSTIQSLGESHIDIGSAAVVPPPVMSHDLSAGAPLVSSEGDVHDLVIDEIVEEDSSSSEEGDIEEGQLDEEEEEEVDLPSAVTTTTTPRDSQSPPTVAVTSSGVTMVSSISSQVSSVPMGGEGDEPPPAKKKPEPIVWSQPSSSSGAGSSGTARRGAAKRKIMVRRGGSGGPPQTAGSQGGTARRGGPRFKAKSQK